MKSLAQLFAKNREWSEQLRSQDPGYFSRLADGQAPEYLWIGCSDSRVPANQIIGLPPGDIFVHRNIANVVSHGDLNCLSVIQFAVEVLKVKHLIVCGHYDCGGIKAVQQGVSLGLTDNWLEHVHDVQCFHSKALAKLPPESQLPMLCELNVIEQLHHAAQTSIVQQAWKRGQELYLHGWIYGVEDGLLRDLKVGASSAAEFQGAYEAVVESLISGRQNTLSVTLRDH
ncbi:MAG: carbonate dehydratase [Alphaproteobacteria bacterium]